MIVRDAVWTDVMHLAPRLRQADQDELAAHGVVPLHALAEGLADKRGGVCKTITTRENEEPVAMGGVRSVTPGTGAVWLLGTDYLVNDGKRAFLRISREWVDRMNKLFPFLYNFVHQPNTVHIRWLQWCGFHVYGNPYDINGHPFLYFERRHHV